MSVLSAGPEFAVLTLEPPTTKKLNLILGEYGSDLTFPNGIASYQATLGNTLIAASRAESSSGIFVTRSALRSWRHHTGLPHAQERLGWMGGGEIEKGIVQYRSRMETSVGSWQSGALPQLLAQSLWGSIWLIEVRNTEFPGCQRLNFLSSSRAFKLQASLLVVMMGSMDYVG
ncbi:hypothetical protein ONZ45_g6885 [Pleurotus djamor]|nr:hypothetical protein ONZ45_g6885 [Pleurotus djamor]